jgi:hypothetical protein
MDTASRFFWNFLIWVDQGLNTVLGWPLNLVLDPDVRFGDPDETLSSVFGKNVRAGSCKTCRVVCRVLDWIDPGHCERSVERDEGRRAL